jgi:hypothetical protein
MVGGALPLQNKTQMPESGRPESNAKAYGARVWGPTKMPRRLKITFLPLLIINFD